MPPITSTGFSLSDYQAQTSSTDPTTDSVQPGESTMSDVAGRLRVDLNSLLKANPQIADPNQLTPGQEIQLPQPQAPGPLQDNSPVATQPPTPNLPRRPIGASDEAYAMKAVLQFREQSQRCTPDDNTKRSLDENAAQTSIPDTDSPEWQHQQVGINLSAINSAGEEAAKNEALAAQQRLHDLGLPPAPPKVTMQDLASLKGAMEEPDTKELKDKTAEVLADGAKDAAYHAGLHVVEHMTQHIATTTADIGVATESGIAAESLELMSGVGTIAGIIGLTKGLFDMGSQMNDVRKANMSQVENNLANLSENLVKSKFPQYRELNDRGKEQLGAVVDKWKDGTNGTIENVVQHLINATLGVKEGCLPHGPGPGASTACVLSDQEKESATSQAKTNLAQILAPATVDLANEQMKVYYDPRNWNESQSVGVTAK